LNYAVHASLLRLYLSVCRGGNVSHSLLSDTVRGLNLIRVPVVVIEVFVVFHRFVGRLTEEEI